MSALANTKNTGPLVALIMQMLRPVWPYWLVGTICTTGFSLFMVGIASVQQSFLDLILAGQLQALYRLLIIWGAGLAGTIAIGCFGWYLINYGTALATRNFRRRLHAHVNGLPIATLEEQHTGDLVSRIHSDTAQAVGSFAGSVAGFTTALVSAVMAFFYLSRIHFWLTVLITIAGPLLFILGRLFDARLRHLGEAIQKNDASIRSFLQEDLQSMEVVRAFGLEDWANERFRQLRVENRDLSLKQALTRNCMSAVNDSSALLFSIGTSVVVALEAIQGHLSTGTLLAFVILLNRLTMPFVQASNTWGGMQQAFSAAKRVREILLLPQELVSDSVASAVIPGEPHAPALELDNATFAYNGRDAVINNLSLRIQPGEVVGLVGGSGTGKTTLARLALGLLQPQKGEVRVCGWSTATQLSAVRSCIAYVPQMPYLFNDTVLANTVCGRAAELTVDAEEMLGLRSLAEQLPEGLNTRVGERGVQVSGGQRQRIALARALWRQPQLIILDEATSALDNETEVEMQQLLNRCRGNAAVLIIAHRLSTVANADRILVVDAGHIVEEGTHNSLLAVNGFYSRLWAAASAANAASA